MNKREKTSNVITAIIERARALKLVVVNLDGKRHWYSADTMRMDLSSCVYGAFDKKQAVKNFDVEKLLAFDNFDFTHDIVGIAKHMDRSTGDMGGMFVPRCART